MDAFVFATMFQAVAPIVGRADLLCGVLSMIAVTLTITTTGGQVRGHTSTATASDGARKTVPEAAIGMEGLEVAQFSENCSAFDKSMAPPTVFQGAGRTAVVSNNEVRKGKTKMAQRAKMRGKTVYRKRKAGQSPSSPAAAAMAHSSTRRVHATADKAGKQDTGPGVARFSAALVLAVGSALCKEIGITVFGLLAGGEVVRFIEEYDRQQRQQPRRSNVSTTAPRKASQDRIVRQQWGRSRFSTRVPVAAVARIVSSLTCAALLVVLHVRLREGARVREWGVLENDISILARWELKRVAHRVRLQRSNKCRPKSSCRQHDWCAPLKHHNI